MGQHPRIATKGFREPSVEEFGGIEDAGGDPGRLRLESVPPQAPGDERVVERPDRSDVIADRVEATFAFGERADALP